MKKYIANIITGGRILCSLPLLFVPTASVWFYTLYLFCGITDMIDGTIARKAGAVNELGSRLDTIADFVFLAVAFFKLLPIMRIMDQKIWGASLIIWILWKKEEWSHLLVSKKKAQYR